MRGAEGVVLALVAAREAGDAAELAQRRHALAPAGQHLVRIGLVAHVPDEAVVRRVEDVVQRDRQLDRAEVATTGGRRSATRCGATNSRSSSASCLQLARATGGAASAGIVRSCRAAVAMWSMCCLSCRDRRPCRPARAGCGASARPLRAERGVRLRRAARRRGARAASRPSSDDVGRLVAGRGPCRRSCRASPRPA